jgi:hypothetical protein
MVYSVKAKSVIQKFAKQGGTPRIFSHKKSDSSLSLRSAMDFPHNWDIFEMERQRRERLVSSAWS